MCLKVFRKMLNQLAVVPFYLACQTLMPEHFPDTNITEFDEETMMPIWSKLAMELPEGYTVFPEIRAAYKLYRNHVRWAEAQRYCAGEGGYLAITDSYKKVIHVLDLKGPGDDRVHVGIHRLFDDSEWVELKTGLPPVMIPWRSPSYATDMSRKCAMIIGVRSGVFAADCNLSSYFVCEIPIVKE